MKYLVTIFLLCIQLQLAKAQERITVTTDKTTCLLFPAAITHVDKGSSNLFVSNIKDADNLLMVKAATRKFPETNISIVTTDGKLYSILVQYDSVPTNLVYQPTSSEKLFEKETLNEDAIKNYAAHLLNLEREAPLLSRSKGKVKLSVFNMYIKESVFFLKLVINNGSAIPYDIDELQFFIKDYKTAKRTAVQELEVIPINMIGNTGQINKNQDMPIVVAMEKFTLPAGKYFEIAIDENNGGRNIRVRLSNKKVMKTKTFPCL